MAIQKYSAFDALQKNPRNREICPAYLYACELIGTSRSVQCQCFETLTIVLSMTSGKKPVVTWTDQRILSYGLHLDLKRRNFVMTM